MNAWIGALIGYAAGASMSSPEGARAMALFGLIMLGACAVSCVLWGLWQAVTVSAELLRGWLRK